MSWLKKYDTEGLNVKMSNGGPIDPPVFGGTLKPVEIVSDKAPSYKYNQTPVWLKVPLETALDQRLWGKATNITTQALDDTESDYARGLNLALEGLKLSTGLGGDFLTNIAQEGVSYLGNINPKGVDNTAKRFWQEQGRKPLYQNGGPINPIYVTDKNDPRLRSYNDSLSLHRQYYTDLDALRAELAEDDRTINRIGSLPFNRYSYQSNYASDPIKPESIVGFRSPEIDYTWQIPYYRKPVQPVVYRKPATVSSTGTVRSVPVETVAPVLPKRETLLPISTDVVPMQTAGSYSEPTLMPDNLPRVAYKADEPRASIMYPYSAARELAAMNKPVGYGKDTDGTEVEFSAKEWDKMKGTKYSEFNKPEKKAYGGWLNTYEEGGGIDPIKGYKKEEPSSTATNIRPVVSSLEEGRKLAFKDAVNRSIQVAKQEQAAKEAQYQKDLYNKRAETPVGKVGKQLTDFGTSLATAPKRIANTVFTAVTPDIINDSPQSYANRVYNAATISDEDLWKGRIGTPVDKAGMIAEGAAELALMGEMPSASNIRMGAGMLADDVVNIPNVAKSGLREGVDLVHPVGRKLRQIEQEGIAQGLSPQAIKNRQMQEVGITSLQREGYFPGVSEVLSEYIVPYSYDNAKKRLLDIPKKIIKGDTNTKRLADSDRVILDRVSKPRYDAWRLYSGLPQKYGTFRMAETTPINHPSYTPNQLTNLEKFSLNDEKRLLSQLPNEYDNLRFVYNDKDLIEAIPYLKEELENINKLEKTGIDFPKSDFNITNVMGGYNRRFFDNKMEYNDIWDLNLNGLKVDKYYGKPFMSHGQLDYSFEPAKESINTLLKRAELLGKNINSFKTNSVFDIIDSKKYYSQNPININLMDVTSKRKQMGGWLNKYN